MDALYIILNVGMEYHQHYFIMHGTEDLLVLNEGRAWNRRLVSLNEDRAWNRRPGSLEKRKWPVGH